MSADRRLHVRRGNSHSNRSVDCLNHAPVAQHRVCAAAQHAIHGVGNAKSGIRVGKGEGSAPAVMAERGRIGTERAAIAAEHKSCAESAVFIERGIQSVKSFGSRLAKAACRDQPVLACRKQAIKYGERASRCMAIGGWNVRGAPGSFVRGQRGNRGHQIGVVVSGALLFIDPVFHVAAGDQLGNAVVLVIAEPDMKVEPQRLSNFLGDESARHASIGAAQRLSSDVPVGKCMIHTPACRRPEGRHRCKCFNAGMPVIYVL